VSGSHHHDLHFSWNSPFVADPSTDEPRSFTALPSPLTFVLQTEPQIRPTHRNVPRGLLLLQHELLRSRAGDSGVPSPTRAPSLPLSVCLLSSVSLPLSLPLSLLPPSPRSDAPFTFRFALLRAKLEASCTPIPSLLRVLGGTSDCAWGIDHLKLLASFAQSETAAFYSGCRPSVAPGVVAPDKTTLQSWLSQDLPPSSIQSHYRRHQSSLTTVVTKPLSLPSSSIHSPTQDPSS
jgi:hypothetical protein